MYWTKRYLGGVIAALVLGFSAFTAGNLGAEQLDSSSDVALSVRVGTHGRFGGRGYYGGRRHYRQPYYRHGHYSPYRGGYYRSPYWRYRSYRYPYYRNYYYEPYNYGYGRGGSIQFYYGR